MLALQLMMAAIEHAGFKPGGDVVVAIDVAAHSLWDPERQQYHLAREGRHVDTEEIVDTVCGWVDDFPVASVEDALDEEGWAGWQEPTPARAARQPDR